MRLLIVCAVLALSGCAVLPAKEADAFRTLAAADRDAFTALAVEEDKAVTAYAQAYLVKRPGTEVGPNDNCGPGQPGTCQITLKTQPKPLVMGVAAPETRALIISLADYGASMSELAEAKDLAAAKTAASKAGASVKGLFAVIPNAPAIIGPIVDGVVWVQGLRFQEKRRRALLAAATQADPAVALAADRMGDISDRLRANLELSAIDKLTAANKAYQQAPSDQNFSAMLAAAGQVNAARQIRTNYSPLKDGHRALVKALSSRDSDPSVALAQLQTFVGLLKAAKAAADKDEARS